MVNYDQSDINQICKSHHIWPDIDSKLTIFDLEMTGNDLKMTGTLINWERTKTKWNFKIGTIRISNW